MDQDKKNNEDTIHLMELEQANATIKEIGRLNATRGRPMNAEMSSFCTVMRRLGEKLIDHANQRETSVNQFRAAQAVLDKDNTKTEIEKGLQKCVTFVEMIGKSAEYDRMMGAELRSAAAKMDLLGEMLVDYGKQQGFATLPESRKAKAATSKVAKKKRSN